MTLRLPGPWDHDDFKFATGLGIFRVRYHASGPWDAFSPHHSMLQGGS